MDLKIKLLWELENEDVCIESLGLSQEDKKVLDLWNNEVKLIDEC